MYQSKECRHFLKQVKEEPNLGFCEVCNKSYEQFEMLLEVPRKWWYTRNYKGGENK